MDTIELIHAVNPEWGNRIFMFLCDYPEFQPYMHLAPLSPKCTIPYANVHSVFQAILYYVCASGVRFSYALQQWELLYISDSASWEETVQHFARLKDDPRIQKKKREIYFNICMCMVQHSITKQQLNETPELVSIFRTHVSGIGDGCVAWVHRYFTLRDDCVEYTDICFRKGFRIVYGAEKDTTRFRKQMVAEWNQKQMGRVANLFIFRIM